MLKLVRVANVQKQYTLKADIDKFNFNRAFLLKNVNRRLRLSPLAIRFKTEHSDQTRYCQNDRIKQTTRNYLLCVKTSMLTGSYLDEDSVRIATSISTPLRMWSARPVKRYPWTNQCNNGSLLLPPHTHTRQSN